MVLQFTDEELSDLNVWVFEKLRHQFGAQVDADWCHDFTCKVGAQAMLIREEHFQAYHAARNKRMVELVESKER